MALWLGWDLCSSLLNTTIALFKAQIHVFYRVCELIGQVMQKEQLVRSEDCFQVQGFECGEGANLGM